MIRAIGFDFALGLWPFVGAAAVPSGLVPLVVPFDLRSFTSVPCG